VRLFAVDYRPIDRDGPWPGCGLFAKHPLSRVHHQQVVRFFDLKAGERFVAVKRAAMPPATLFPASTPACSSSRTVIRRSCRLRWRVPTPTSFDANGRSRS
jgi:hypothetical protein